MKLIPKKTKYKKHHRGRLFNKVSKPFLLKDLNSGNLKLISLEFGEFNSNQLKMLKENVSKKIKKFGRVRLSLFSDVAVSKKPVEVRMGKGKGNVDFWVSKFRSGSIICEVSSSSLVVAHRALKYVQTKLPVKTKII